MKNYYIISLIFFLSQTVLAQPDGKYNKLNKPNRNDHYNYIAANNILMWISNNGDGSHNPTTDGRGFNWPGAAETTKGAVYEDGLIYGAKVNNEIRVNGNTHRQGLQAGKIINGQPDDPALEKYRVYKIKKGWDKLPSGPERDALEKDYNEWPIEDGAPYIDVNKDGKPTRGIDKPKHVGDETLWYVANDLDPKKTRLTYGMDPMGLEFQTTVFSFTNTSALHDMVFKKYKIINKGNNVLEDMIISYWSDPDLGDAGDDYTGCDTVLNLGYVWNGKSIDDIYGTPPPAAGYVYLQGPIVPGLPTDSAKFGDGYRYGYRNLPMTAFAMYINAAGAIWRDPQPGIPKGSVEMYNYMQGKLWDGSEIIDPHTGNAVVKMLAGDPVSGAGWYNGEGWPAGPPPSDVRLLISSGTFTMSPGDTQEVVMGIVIGRGSDNVSSISSLRKNASQAIKLYNSFFKTDSPPPPAPAFHSVPMDRKITLWWEKSDEEYSITDPLLPDTIINYSELKDFIIPVTGRKYNFEGYRIWKYSDETGSNPEVIATIDKKNNISTIKHYLSEYLGAFAVFPPYAAGEDAGIYRYKIIENHDDEPFNNGSQYYYGVTAYAYSKFSDPPVIESLPEIIEVIPGLPPVDAQYTYNAQSIINFKHSGPGDGEVRATVIDPDLLNGHKYEVIFEGDPSSAVYSFIDAEDKDTLISGSTDFSIDSLDKNIFNGSILYVDNPARKYSSPRVKSVQEIRGPGGVEIIPVNVFSTYTTENKNSTGQWTTTSVDERQTVNGILQNLAYKKHIGINDYEIRFTETGSEFYSSGYRQISPLQQVDPKGKGKLPFEIWRIPLDPDAQPVRLIIKIFDSNQDTGWTQAETGAWESIYTFEPLNGYPDPLPQQSTANIGATDSKQYRMGNFVIKGDQPMPGSVIKLSVWKPLSSFDKFTAVMTAPKLNNPELAKQNINDISAFPNPYFSAKSLIQVYPGYVRFTNLPHKITIRLFSLSGVFIKKIEKDDDGQYADWDLKNKDGLQVASGIYLAYLEIPGVATRIIKLALVN